MTVLTEEGTHSTTRAFMQLPIKMKIVTPLLLRKDDLGNNSKHTNEEALIYLVDRPTI